MQSASERKSTGSNDQNAKWHPSQSVARRANVQLWYQESVVEVVVVLSA